MLHYILITISVLASTLSLAQDTLSFPAVNNITSFAMDAKGNQYVSDNSLTLYKFDAAGKLITNVNIKSYGDITSIDCSNPFELYVYHQDQNIIVFYDNMLNQRGEIRLNDLYFNNVACVARSFDNNIWLVDLSQYKLLKINKKGEKLAESPFLNNILGHTFNPTKMWEENNNVYIVDTSNGIHQFDMYATFATTYFHPGITDAFSLGDRFVLKQGTQLLTYHKLLRNPVELKITVPSAGILTYDKTFVYNSMGSKLIKQLLR
ncbi:MAG: hypothetical protein QMC70_02850 [Bacteroidia bacterium]|jgi:hypothetical protein|tara:strand:+ start:2491 stop:3279 length:789 start_codon:yes stop_codon:yes gene_type:complete